MSKFRLWHEREKETYSQNLGRWKPSIEYRVASFR